MVLEKPHPIGTEIDRLCGGLERFGRAGYGNWLTNHSYFSLPERTSREYPGNDIEEWGIVYFYVTPSHHQLFVQDVGTRGKISYQEVGRVGSYDNHRAMKEGRVSEAYRSWPGHGFGAGVSHVLDLERDLKYDDRPRIWRPSFQKEDYNYFFEVRVLPFGMWYREGAERESPAMEVILNPEYHRHSESFRNDFKATLKRFRALPKSKSIDKIKMRELRELLGR